MKRVIGLKSHLNIGKLFADIGISTEQDCLNAKLHWSDNCAYELSVDEVEYLEKITNELFQMCLSVIETEIKQGDYVGYSFSTIQKALIERDWKEKRSLCYGYFDWNFVGGNLVLKGSNFSSPQCLIESSLLQWKWLEQLENNGNKDQYNWIHQAFINHLTNLIRIPTHFHLIDTGDYQLHYLKDVLEISGYNFNPISTGGEQEISSMDESWFQNDKFLEYMLEKTIYLFEPGWSQILNHSHFIEKMAKQYKLHSLFNEQSLNLAKNHNLPIIMTWIVGESSCGLAIKEKIAEHNEVQHRIIPHYFLE